jgi:hypothetical protein
MEELSPLEKLDAVLACLDKYRTEKPMELPSLNETLKRDTGVDFWGELISILRKLEKDEYIYIRGGLWGDGTNIYLITFEGRIYLEQGGYTQQRIKENAENIRLNKIENNQRLHRVLITILTVVLAIGTSIAAVYYLHELSKKQ